MDYEQIMKAIKPKNVRESDKYSSQIYKYLKDNPNLYTVMYDRNVYDSDSGCYIRKDFDVKDLEICNIFFGKKDYNLSRCIIGKNMRALVGCSRDKYATYAYTLKSECDIVDITEEFYKAYIRIGRCLYTSHNTYTKNDDKRFKTINERSRFCIWCGKRQVKENFIITEERWV